MVLEDAPQRPKSIAPGNLLPLFVSPTVVGDRDLVDAPALAAGYLGGNLRFETEASLLNGNPGQHLTPEHLVADLHVGQVEVRHHIGKGGQEAVAHVVPEEDDTMRAAAEEARAKDERAGVTQWY